MYKSTVRKMGKAKSAKETTESVVFVGFFFSESKMNFLPKKKIYRIKILYILRKK